VTEKGAGKTSFFAHLSGQDKKKILDWSSKSSEAASLSSETGSGKCYLFSTLPEDEKKHLLDRLMDERRHQESEFPHLRKYKGYEEVTLLGTSRYTVGRVT
jgi:hypothetical protein